MKAVRGNKAHTYTYIHFCICSLFWKNYESVYSVLVRAMVFYATFNNISSISWRSVVFVEETRVPAKNRRQTLSNNVVSSTAEILRVDMGCKNM